MDLEMTPDLARALLMGKWKRRKVTEADVAAFLEKWEEQEPVMPVSMVCDAFRSWQDAMQNAPDNERAPSMKASLLEMANKAGGVFFAIGKSNLLWRLLYLGERLRTKPCPVHRGHWSGCVGSKAQTGCGGACLSGNNVTGWLPEPGDEADEVTVPHVKLG